MSKAKFKVGSEVRVKGYRQTAVIAHFLPDVKGGVVLSRAYDGLRYWNVMDLVAVPKRRKSGRRLTPPKAH